MEQGLRDCCRSIRIGKILVESDVDTHEAKVVYARFPEDIANRMVSSHTKELTQLILFFFHLGSFNVSYYVNWKYCYSSSESIKRTWCKGRLHYFEQFVLHPCCS